jgi:short-subunit dehydrogenase
MTETSRPVAVISGATEGIGRAIAEKLLGEGFNVAICARSEEKLKALQRQWENAFPEARTLCRVADFEKPDDVKVFAAAVLEFAPNVRILVNNAGIFEPGDLMTEPDGQLERIMQVNLFSAASLSRALLPAIGAGGHIFNICSVAALKAYPGGGSYSVSKYALLGFSENLRHELMPLGIRVTAISPGATWSRSWSGSGVPRERIMEAEDIAAMLWATWSLSPKADVEHLIMRPIAGDL